MSFAEKPFVLIVDDNDATCTLMAAVLQRDFLCDVATDGLDAIEQLKTKQYAAILLDIRMPQLDGYGVLDYLKEHRPETLRKVLIVTAALTERELSRMEKYEVFGVLPKPFDVEVLLATVKQCAAPGDNFLGSGFFKSTMMLLLADLIQKRLM